MTSLESMFVKKVLIIEVDVCPNLSLLIYVRNHDSCGAVLYSCVSSQDVVSAQTYLLSCHSLDQSYDDLYSSFIVMSPEI